MISFPESLTDIY